MHYNDPEQIDDNSLKLVIYTHGGDPLGTVFDITSIQECRHFSPRLLTKVMNMRKPRGGRDCWYQWFNKPQFNALPLEKYYLVWLEQTGWDDITIMDITDVTNDTNQFYQLH
jgi:hypothetical protein